MGIQAGTPTQQRLQKKSDSLAEWTRRTPGACNAGRMIGADDPDRLGWDTLIEHLGADGVFGFRLLAADEVPAVRARLSEHGFRLDLWNVFSGDAATVLAACEKVLSVPLTDGLDIVDSGSGSGATTERILDCMVRCGVAPFSGDMLEGRVVPSVTLGLFNAEGTVAATACAYMPHNRTSPFEHHAWVGLVAVDRDQRRRGLGVYVNALAVRAAVERLGASHVYELAAETNIASRRMIERSGLTLDAGRMSGIAQADGSRFTR